MRQASLLAKITLTHPKPGNAKPRQQGVVLVSALLVLAIVAVLAYAMVEQTQQMITQSAAREQSAQAKAFADGMFGYALLALARERQESGNIDTRSEAWAQALPSFPIPRGVVGGLLDDQNGRINLNALAKSGGDASETMARLERLLTSLRLDPSLAKRIADAIDADGNSDGGGEDASLMGFDPALRAPNRQLAHISEIAPVVGEAAYERLAPYICAIDRQAPLNINTASIAVLQSLAPSMTRDLAERMYARGQANYPDVTGFVTELSQAGVTLDGEQQRLLSVISTHFVAQANIKLDEETYQFTAMLERSDGTLAIRWQARGAF
jgi:general secretion pathway protein K